MKFNSIKFLMAINLLASAGLSSCLKVNPTAENQSSEKSAGTMTGIVQAGRVTGATVTAYTLDDSGNRGVVLGTTQTDSNGNFSVDLSSLSGTIEYVVTGGQYLDESTQLIVTLKAGEELTLISSDLASNSQVPITPLTSQVAARVKENMSPSATVSTLISSASQEVAEMWGVSVETIAAIPSDPNLPVDANSESGKAAFVLAALSRFMETQNLTEAHGVSPIGFLAKLNSAFASDGQLGGTSSQSSDVIAFSNSWVSGLQTAMRDVNEQANFSSVDVSKFQAPTAVPTTRVVVSSNSTVDTSSTNGTTTGTTTGTTAGTTTGTTSNFTGPYRMFVSESLHDARLLTNLAAMDAACTTQGNRDFSVNHHWYALVSVPGTHARDRIIAEGIYVNTNSTPQTVANNLTQLWSGTILNPINFHSNGTSPPSIGGNGDHIWTGSMNDGTFPTSGYASTTCDGYTSTNGSYNGMYGNSGQVGTWLAGGPSGCNMQYYIYCVEQP